MIKTDVALQLKGTHQRIVQMMQSKISQYDLTFGLLHTLMLIEKNPDASQKQLSEDLNFTQGAMSIVVKRLLEKNMLIQTPLESDMRYNRLMLTEKGRATINDYKDHITNWYQNVFHGFNENELNLLYSFLLQINENLDTINNEYIT